MAGVHLRITGDANGYVAATRQAEAATGKMVGSISEEARKINNIFKTLATGAGTLFTVQMASQFSKQVAQVRGEFQQLEVAFETMLQSKEKADALMAQVVDTAAKTPFDLQGVANGAKQLLAYGVASEEVNDTLIRLGDIAAGLSIPLNDLVYLYGTTMTQGRLFTQDLRQFQGRGIPLADELAKQFGVTKDAVGELVTAGKVGFPEVQKAILAMTNEGGKFNNLMAKQSQTITGQISNLEDAIDQMFNEIGKSSEGAISGAIGMASSLVENYEKVGRVVGGIVTAYGSYKTALIVFNAVKKAAVAWEAADAVAKRASAISTKNLTASTVLLAKAQKALNASMLANPYVLAAAAVAALGVGIYAFVTAKSKEEKIHEKVNKQLETYRDNLEKQKAQLQELFDTMNSPSATDMQRVIAMEQLRELFPGYLKDLSDEELLKLSAAEATKKLVEENERLLRQDIGSQIANLATKYEQAVAVMNERRSVVGSNVKDSLVDNYLRGDKEYREASKAAEGYRIKLEALLTKQKELDDAAQKADFLALPADQKIVSLKESNAQLDTEIAELDKKLKELHDKKSGAATEQPQEFKLGSLSGAMYDGGMTEEQILAEIKARQEQKALNDKDIAENQAKVDANNKTLSDKQKKANYERQKADEKAGEELAKMKRDINNKVAQADIDSMEDGYAKTIKQLEHNLALENQAIEQQKEALKKRKYNDALQSWLAEDPENNKAWDFKYTATLTAEELAVFEEMGKFAQQQFDKGREDAGKKWSKEAGFFQRQFEIDAMSDGSEKDKAQRQLNNEKELHNLELQKDAFIEAAKAAHLLAVAKGEASGEFDPTEANNRFNALFAQVVARQKKTQLDAEEEAWHDYYIKYGNYKEKVLHITEQYAERIEDASTEGEKKSLAAERDAILESLENAQNIAYKNIFKDPAKLSLTSVKQAIALANKEIKKITSKGALNDNDIENLKALQEAVDRLQSYTDSAPFDRLGDGLDGLVAKFNTILSINEKIAEAKKSGNKEAQAAAEEELSATKENLKENLIGVGVEGFASGLSMAADALERIAEISGDPNLQLTADVLSGFSNVVSAAGTGAATGGWIGAIVGGVTAILSEVTNAITDFIAASKTNEKAMNDYAQSLQLLALTVDKDSYDAIFGMDKWEYLLALGKKKSDAYIKLLDDTKEKTEIRYKQIFDTTLAYEEYYTPTWSYDYSQPYQEITQKAVGNAYIKAKGKRKVRKQYTGTLSEIFPDLFNEDGTLRLDKIEEAKKALETLNGMKLKDTEGRDRLDEAIKDAEAYIELTKQIEEAVGSYFDTWADSIGDAVVDSIMRGEDAMKSFEDIALGVIDTLARDLAKSFVLSNYLNAFSEDMQAAFTSGDPKDIINIIDKILLGLPNAIEGATAATQGVLEYAESIGLDVSKLYDSTRDATSKGVMQASQNSIDEVNGKVTNIQSHTFSINQHLASVVNINSQILSSVKSIDGHTSRLETIESDMTYVRSDISDLVRVIKNRL